MAKGVEDTAFYRLQPAGLAERGGRRSRALRHLGRGVPRAQRRAAPALAARPVATATHDTKRSEDVRARLNVLSEMPEEWQAALGRWRRLNRRQRQPTSTGGRRPTPQRGVPVLPDAGRRLAARRRDGDAASAGVPSSGIDARTCRRPPTRPRSTPAGSTPNDAYDDGVPALRRRARSTAGGRAVPRRPATLRRRRSAPLGLLQRAGAGAAEARLRPACPTSTRAPSCGTSRLVDPDNRRPVDFARRAALLAELERAARRGSAGAGGELLDARRDGRVKLYLIWQALAARRRHPALQPVATTARSRSPAGAPSTCAPSPGSPPTTTWWSSRHGGSPGSRGRGAAAGTRGLGRYRRQRGPRAGLSQRLHR